MPAFGMDAIPKPVFSPVGEVSTSFVFSVLYGTEFRKSFFLYLDSDRQIFFYGTGTDSIKIPRHILTQNLSN
jgi:hypothetical protein